MNELELINTIFYYADTMDEYRLALLENKVLSRTIVFVDETREIYKDGKLFGGYEKFVGQLLELALEVRDAMDRSENEVSELMRRLREQIWSLFQEEVELINNNIDDYIDELNRLKEEFALGKIEEGQARLDIDALNGIISEYVSWKTSVEGTLTTFSRVMNALDATLRTFGLRLDAFNDTVTNYEHLVDLKEQTLKEYIENYDIKEKVRSIIGREILLQDGLLHDFATRTDVNSMVRTSVDTWYNSLDPSWTLLTSWAQEGSEALNRITVTGGIESRITQLGDTVDSVLSTVTLFSNWYDENKEFIAYLKTSANGNEASFDLQAALNENNGNNELVHLLSARIFGYVNDEGSTLLLLANRINFQGYNMTVDVDHVEGLGDWLLGSATVGKFQATDGSGRTIKINADSNDVYGIKSSTNGFYFKMDGSGWVANGAITWDAYGNLTIQGQAPNPYTPSGLSKTVVLNNVYISDYWSKTEFIPSNYVTTALLGDLSGINNNLKLWVLELISNAGSQEGQEINIEQLVLTYLNNEISRADGPFRNYVTTDGLNSKLLTDGYITRQGLYTEVRALIYDGNGDLIGGGILYDALSTLNTLSTALIDNGLVVGTYTQQELYSKINDYINGDSALSSLRTWAQTIDGNSTAGFTLLALVNTVTGNNTLEGASGSVGAYISGIVQDGLSNITISADLINLDFADMTYHFYQLNSMISFMDGSNHPFLSIEAESGGGAAFYSASGNGCHFVEGITADTLLLTGNSGGTIPSIDFNAGGVNYAQMYVRSSDDKLVITDSSGIVLSGDVSVSNLSGTTISATTLASTNLNSNTITLTDGNTSRGMSIDPTTYRISIDGGIDTNTGVFQTLGCRSLLAITGNVLVGSSNYGWDGTLQLPNATITVKKGIIVGATGTNAYTES